MPLLYMPLLCVCVGIPLYMCLHTSIYVSAYLYTCVRIPPFVSASPIYGEVCCARAYVRCASSRVNESAYLYMCPHASICVRIPLYVSASSRRRAATICSTLYVSSYLYMCVRYSYMVRGAVYVSSYLCICVLIPLYLCPHTSICVLIPLHVCSVLVYGEGCCARACGT